MRCNFRKMCLTNFPVFSSYRKFETGSCSSIRRLSDGCSGQVPSGQAAGSVRVAPNVAGGRRRAEGLLPDLVPVSTNLLQTLQVSYFDFFSIRSRLLSTIWRHKRWTQLKQIHIFHYRQNQLGSFVLEFFQTKSFGTYRWWRLSLKSQWGLGSITYDIQLFFLFSSIRWLDATSHQSSVL